MLNLCFIFFQLDALQNKPVNKLFKNFGIETAIHYEIPIHKTKVYKSKS